MPVKDKQLFFLLSFVATLGSAVLVYVLYTKGISFANLNIGIGEDASQSQTTPTSLMIFSPAYGPGEKIPAIYTCQGKNINPPLKISGVPANARSLVLTFEDPDALIKTFDHWVVFNISPLATTIDEDSPNPGISGQNSYGKGNYTGPCPPSGSHRYVFKLYALDTILELKAGATKQAILNTAGGHIIETATYTGLFQKN